MIKKIIIKFFLIFLCAQTLMATADKPRRVVSLMPSNTEIVYELGLQDRLLAVTNYCDYPAPAQTKEKIGDFLHPNLEKILMLKPDLVLAGQWKNSSIVARLRQNGVQVKEVFLPQNVADIYKTVDIVATAMGEKEKAQVLIDQWQKRQNLLSATSQTNKRPTFYIEIDPPNWTVSKGSYINDALERCGAQNVFRDLALPGAQITWESVLEKNPDVLIILGADRQSVARRPGWKHLRAVKQGHIIDKNDHLFVSRPTGRIFSAMEIFKQKLKEFGY